MAFDEKLAARVRTHLGKRAGLTEKKMFGGIAFLIKGKMCCGIHRDALMVRLDPQRPSEHSRSRTPRNSKQDPLMD